MYSQFQASYQRVEQSLQRLTDSIAAYNPSTNAADELLAADDAVNHNLKQLAKHQTNHARIQQLRRTTDSLDETIKSTIRLLAETRRDVLAIPSVESENSGKARREVKVDELLAYAKFISKTTVPPTFRKPLPEQQALLQPRPASNGDSGTPAQISNGIATPPVGAQEEGLVGASTAAAAAGLEKLDNLAVKQLDETAKDFLDPLKNLPFEPWPSHDVIHRGGLAEIQRMVEEGRDPASVLTKEEQEEAERRKAQAEEEEKRREEEESQRQRALHGAGRRTTQNDVFDPDAM